MADSVEQKIYERLRRVGAAISRVNGNNTHSGNLSMRHPSDTDIFYITSSGSQCGALLFQDVVPLRFSRVSWGDARGSTESVIHRKVLRSTDSKSVIHAHFIYTTVLSFDTKEKGLFLQFLGVDNKGREEFLFYPVDIWGGFAVGGVRVGSYNQPVGSEEMEERIPQYLKQDKITIVRGHGSFVRASSPEEALHMMSVLESSAKLTLYLKRRGVDVVKIQKKIMANGPERFYTYTPHYFYDIDQKKCDIQDQSLIEDFRQRLNYNYNHQLSAYGAGSMSQKVSSEEMIFCPQSAVPDDFEFPLFRMGLAYHKNDTLELGLHKLIYHHTHQNSCMITTSPAATSEGMAVLAETYGSDVLFGQSKKISYKPDDHPFIRPIDAEAIYLNPKIGLVEMGQAGNISAENPILNMLRWYKGCCVVAGYGVISTGDTTLEQAAHNAASAERIAQFRLEVFINEKICDGPSVDSFEDR